MTAMYEINKRWLLPDDTQVPGKGGNEKGVYGFSFKTFIRRYSTGVTQKGKLIVEKGIDQAKRKEDPGAWKPPDQNCT